MKTRSVNIIECSDWDDLVQKTYGRVYCFQQQNGCRDGGTYNFTVPNEETNDDKMNDEIPEIVNHETIGVKFAMWLARDPNQNLPGKNIMPEFSRTLWWSRNFYPDLQTVANDLHIRGLIEAGDYVINIDW